MGLADWIFLGILAVIAVLGGFLGFGKVLDLVANKIAGWIISVVLCYCFGGMILDIPFVHTMMTDLAANWAHIDILVKMHLEIIIFYIVLFILTVLIRVLLVKIVRGVFEADNGLCKVLNKCLGVVAAVLVAFVLMFLVFQIILWIGGATAASFENSLAGTSILLPLYHWNPMAGLIHLF